MTDDKCAGYICSCGYKDRDPDDGNEGCPSCGTGTPQKPHRVMCEQGGGRRVPYAEWCVCSKCNYIQRSTIIFDYYAAVGELLLCESCALHGTGTGMPKSAAEQVNAKVYHDKMEKP